MDNNLNDKYIKLIDLDDEFSIKKDFLLRLINSDNIKNEQSYQILENLGGINALIAKLNSNPSEGLNEEDHKDIKLRKQYFGSNDPVVPLTKSFFDCFIQILNQKVFLILIFAATVRLIIDIWKDSGRWFDYSSIYIAVLIICLAMSIIEYSKEKVFVNFQIDINNKLVRVLRNNEEKLISQKDLLVGDILIINAGEIIPVDGIIIKAFSITIDNEETLYVYHNIDYLKQKISPSECDRMEYPFILSGSKVVKGYAYFLVLCIGLETYLSRATIERYGNNENNNNKNQIQEENRNLNEDEEKEYEIGNSLENYITEKNTQINKLMNSRNAADLGNNYISNYNECNNYISNNNETSYKSEDFSLQNNEMAKELETTNNTLNYSPFNLHNTAEKEKCNIKSKNLDESQKNSLLELNHGKSENIPYYKRHHFSININENNIGHYDENIKNILDLKTTKNLDIQRFRSILKRNDRNHIGNYSDKNLDKIINLPSTTRSSAKRINIRENPEILNNDMTKDIVDYAEEFNLLNRTRKNMEIKSGFFRNKSITSFNNFKKKEIINVRSQDKRYTKSDIFYYSPLRNKIEALEQTLSKFGIVASIISGLSFLIVYIVLSYPENFLFSEVLQILIDALLYGLVLLVLAIPEGLPLASTLSAAFSIYKMREENTLIKNIQACETMATINCICTDFNGVFTKNEMKVKKILIEDQVLDEKQIKYLSSEISKDSFDFLCEAISVNTIAYAAKKQNNNQLEFFGDEVEISLIKYLQYINISYKDFRNNKKRQILECSSYSTDFSLSYTIIEMDGKYEYVRLYLRGNPEDLLDNLNNYVSKNETLQPVTPKFKEKIKKFCKDMTKEGDLPIFICYRDIHKEHFYKFRQAYLNKENEFVRTLINQLNLIAVLCMRDEIKEDVKTYLEECNKAGIIIKMITSQDKETAKIAAEKCGILLQNVSFKKENLLSEEDIDPNEDPNTDILNENSNLIINNKKQISNLENSKINKFKDIYNKRANSKLHSISKNQISNNCDFDILDCHEDLKKLIDLKIKKKNLSISNSFHSFEFLINDINKFEKIIQNSKVISKATAKDKYILMSTLKKNGYIVAVTGDSVSDYLAMKSAHVSIAMGFKASDMSKESADIILCDNSFKNILTGIIYGRNIYYSVRKFIQFQITATISIITLALICSLPFINFYFYPNQLLWLNLILDTLGSISLASEQPNKDEVLSKKPYSNKKNIISKSMKIRILVQAGLQIIIIMITVFLSPVIFKIESDMGLKHIEWEENNGIHTTIVFTCLVYLQFFNAFISRNLDKTNLNIFKNLLNHNIFLIVQSLMVILHYILISYGHRLTRSRPLPIIMHLYCFSIASIVLICLPIIKFISNHHIFKFKKLKNTD